MRGEVSLKQKKDTIQALNDFETAIDMDRYDPDGWSARAIVRLQQGKYTDAESDLDQAIHLSAKNAGNYINRALARFHQNNLRGAMSDYDLALDIDPNNFLGHYNRGLLRAQVGDDNRALEDFDFVLKVEPDNMMATFNRGLLRAQTGDYRGAISDYSKVIGEYPNFMAGYYQRAEARKKIGDRKGAEEDEFKIMKMQIDKRTVFLLVTKRKVTPVSDAVADDNSLGKLQWRVVGKVLARKRAQSCGPLLCGVACDADTKLQQQQATRGPPEKRWKCSRISRSAPACAVFPNRLPPVSVGESIELLSFENHITGIKTFLPSAGSLHLDTFFPRRSQPAG